MRKQQDSTGITQNDLMGGWLVCGMDVCLRSHQNLMDYVNEFGAGKVAQQELEVPQGKVEKGRLGSVCLVQVTLCLT